MMQLKKNQEISSDNELDKNSEALGTEEILSLLSKQSQDFQKDSEVSSNIDKFYKKVDLISLAKSKSIKQGSVNEENKNIEKSTVIENEDIKDKNDEEVANKQPEKKYTEEETKVIANRMAKEYYEKGYNLGIKKTKEELQKGDHALAVSLKNVADNLFLKMPEFSEKLNKSINDLLKKSLNEIIGYEIDTKSENFINKIKSIVDSINLKMNNVEVFLNENDKSSIEKYFETNALKLPFKLMQDTLLKRGDIKIKAGSIEVKELVEKKINFSEKVNIEEDLNKIKNTNSTKS